MIDEQVNPDIKAQWIAVGGELRTARERKGLSLDEISLRTRIKRPMLEALEQGTEDTLPRGPFRRGFARAYARELHLDPDLLLAKVPTRSPPVVTAVKPDTFLGDSPVAHRRMTIQLVIWLAIAAAVLNLPRSGAQSQNPPDGRPIATAGVTAAGPRAVGMSGTQAGGDTQRYAAADQTAPGVPVTVELLASGDLWLEAHSDGARAAYELLAPGTRRTFTARRELALRIGDASAVTYRVNGIPGVLLGGPKQVRNVRITPETAPSFQDR